MTTGVPPPFDSAQERRSRIPGVGAQAIAGNPLTDQEVEMFVMFERENWPPDKRRAYIMDSIKRRSSSGVPE